ncbi:DUF305 domain-containing protein [Kribbella sp. NPDC050124]|uniref:DUF305 domain-containing protein n=1 Tax=Kribbella sp. NPDC050124 TaxID=3364114 RepID=UPI0037911AB8
MDDRAGVRRLLLLRVIGVLGLLAAVFAMHGLTAHHDAAMAAPPTQAAHHDAAMAAPPTQAAAHGAEAQPHGVVAGDRHQSVQHQVVPGMMSEEEMSQLGKAKGAEFDKAWIQLMIKHHQGAVTMATAEQKDGKDPAAIALAKKIQAAQTAEIATMQNLLESN